MATTKLNIGPTYTLASATTYALPSKACYTYVQGTAPTISNDNSTFAAIPATGIVTAQFIKSAAADTIISLKAVG